MGMPRKIQKSKSVYVHQLIFMHMLIYSNLNLNLLLTSIQFSFDRIRGAKVEIPLVM
jgi:hypothetical protein